MSQVSKEIDEIINKVKIINVGYERKVTNQFTEYITVYPHSTKEEFINLSRYCTNYQDMLNLLTLIIAITLPMVCGYIVYLLAIYIGVWTLNIILFISYLSLNEYISNIFS